MPAEPEETDALEALAEIAAGSLRSFDDEHCA